MFIECFSYALSVLVEDGLMSIVSLILHELLDERLLPVQRRLFFMIARLLIRRDLTRTRVRITRGIRPGRAVLFAIHQECIFIRIFINTAGHRRTRSRIPLFLIIRLAFLLYICTNSM